MMSFDDFFSVLMLQQTSWFVPSNGWISFILIILLIELNNKNTKMNQFNPYQYLQIVTTYTVIKGL